MIREMGYERYMELVKSDLKMSGACPVRKTLETLSGKWCLPVVYELCKKPSYRFGELKAALDPITSTVLTSALRDLEELGIVSRTQFNEIPPHVEYALTEIGEALFPVFYEMGIWGEEHLCR